jgi:hypothetical protein
MTEQIPDNVVAEAPFSAWELTIRDTFDLKALYVRLHEFFMEEDFVDLFSGKDDYESFYYEKENPDGTKAHKIWWRAKKLAKSPGHDNIVFWIRLDYTTVMMGKKEIMIKGQKVTLDSGELKLEFGLYIDFEGNKKDLERFKNHFILKYFRNKTRTKWNRKLESLAKGEAMAISNDLYELIQVFAGIRPESERSRRDFVPIKGASN